MLTEARPTPRFRVGDYLTDGERLLHVERIDDDEISLEVTLENCATLELVIVPVELIERPGLRRVAV